MNIKTRLDKLERARPAGKNHLVWRELGETQEQALARFKRTAITRRGDTFLYISWAAESPPEIYHTEGHA